ncbi:hypothetical protein ASE08_08670 [Rhizobacter sp. Root16D2]|nr:hypothetical protein ASC88_14775 [Rhizobacter sp. Root29]KQW04355.1 hypothetical protein ASC98_04465 [Rhizobacter sp. Root1238]KRB14513.1 hypothetical protein ASE08_08670 [Rhizobacter sp. Root16D2]
MASAPAIDLHVPESPVLDRTALIGLFRWLAVAGSHPVAVDLSGQQLEPAMADALADMLKKTVRLTSLKLIDCMLPDADVQKVCTAMADNKSVLALHLCDNTCPQSASAIALMLQQNSTLKTLALESCGLEETGIEAIGTAASNNRILEELHLGDNEWGDKGWSAMTTVLENAALLDLRMGLVERPLETVFAAFCEALENNTTLKRLTFGDENELSRAQADCLNQALEKNASLDHLEMLCRPFTSLSGSSQEPAHRGWINNCRLRSVSLEALRFTQPECDALTSLLEHSESRLTSLALKAFNVTGDVRRSLVNAITKNRNLKHLEVDRGAVGISGDQSDAIDRALERNRKLHVAAGKAVHQLWNRSGPSWPTDMAIELGEAFADCTTGSTMTAVVEALFIKV